MNAYNPTGWVDPWGWINAPSTLPNTPGIYTISNGNQVYVGSAGIGKGGMFDRISRTDHKLAQELLSKQSTIVKYKEVDLGTANSLSSKDRILRHFEQQEMNIQKAGDKQLVNRIRAEAPHKFGRNAGIVQQNGASAKPQNTC